MKRILFILLAALPLVSCRDLILEDRTQCPSFLFYDITNGDAFEDYDDVYVSVYSHPKGLLMDEGFTRVDAIQDKEFFFTIRGTEAVKGYGLIGYASLVQNGPVWTLPLGSDYAPLFRFQYRENVQEESFIVPVEMVKDYCHVTIQFTGYETFNSIAGLFPFEIVIRGNTNGINALTGQPERGPFEYRPEETDTGRFEFNVARLADNYLSMDLFGREGIADDPGFNRTFDLWQEILDQGGVNWKEKNLPDVTIEIDYVQWKVSVGITPWDNSSLNYEF